MAKRFVLTVLGGGPGYTLEDTDLWGLRDCLWHCLDTGYLKDNKEWGEGMLEKINQLREAKDGD